MVDLNAKKKQTEKQTKEKKAKAAVLSP